MTERKKRIMKGINIPIDVLEKITNEAKLQMRSITGQIVFMLREYFRLRKEYERMTIIEDIRKPN